MNIKKIIIWGHKLDTGHTHSYVHHGFYRAAKFMGFDAYWLDNRDNVDESIFDDALVISEQWAVFSNGNSNKMPFNKKAVYVVNYVGNKENVENNPGVNLYLGRVKRLIEMRFSCDWGDDKNWEYTFEPKDYIELQEKTSYLEKTVDYDILYSFWATDLLPNEFDESYCNRQRENRAFFVGTIRPDNEYLFHPFAKACQENNVEFMWSNPWNNALSIEQTREEISKSAYTPDFRPGYTATGGYVSCRTFKNFSYGNWPSTNSKKVYEFYDGNIPFSEDTYEIFFKIKEKIDDRKTLHNMMKLVQSNHTFVNRINVMLKSIKDS